MKKTKKKPTQTRKIVKPKLKKITRDKAKLKCISEKLSILQYHHSFLDIPVVELLFLGGDDGSPIRDRGNNQTGALLTIETAKKLSEKLSEL